MKIFMEELIVHIIWASVITIISILIFIWNMKNNRGDKK